MLSRGDFSRFVRNGCQLGFAWVPKKGSQMLVFQFGSNTSSSRLNSRDRLNGDAKDLGLAVTAERFDLDFAVWSKTNNCAAADLRSDGEQNVWGVLYQVPDHLMSAATSGARRSFDAIEGPNYERRPILVRRADGNPIEDPVVTYTVRHPKPRLLTSFEYVSHILCGLREHNAPIAYVQYVKTRIVANNGALADAISDL